MPEALFEWIDCTDKTRPRTLRRGQDVDYRIAQITDLHVPGEVNLIRRLRDLMSPHQNIDGLSHDISALSNELGHHFRFSFKHYLNLIKKTLAGLHRLHVDHLVITGDLVHCGLAPEFLDIRAALEVTGWWGEQRLTVIPGNHDRFNLYEHLPNEPMETFFPVVSPRAPRFKTLPHGIVLLEIDSNRDPIDDRHYLERWLPNTVGRIYPQVLDSIEAHVSDLRSMRLITLVHHHISSDWYPNRPSALSGLMEPAEGVDNLVQAIELIDTHAIILHGHKHDIMPVDYLFNPHSHTPHRVGCPGGFASSFSLNLIDFNTHDEEILTQIKAR